MVPSHRILLSTIICTTTVFLSSLAQAGEFVGRVTSGEDSKVAGAMVTFRFGSPFQERTVYSGDDGSYRMGGLPADTDYTIRVRRIGWQDLRTTGHSGAGDTQNSLDFDLQRHTDAAAVAAQLPAYHWYALLLEEIDDERLREQMVRQCTYCHQQGSLHTRIKRDKQEWEKVFSLMARMGGTIDVELREILPHCLTKRTTRPTLCRA